MLKAHRSIAARLANAGLVLFGLAVVVILGTGGTRIEAGPLSIGLHRLWIPLGFLALFAALRLMTASRHAGLEGALVTFFARQGIPPRDAEAEVGSSARAGAVLGAGAGIVIAAADLVHVTLRVGDPAPALGELLALAGAASALGVIVGAIYGAVCGALVVFVFRALSRCPSRYQAGRAVVALILLATPIVSRVAPPLDDSHGKVQIMLAVAATLFAAWAIVFLLLPAMVLRAARGRWGLTLGGSGLLALVLGLAALGAVRVPSTPPPGALSSSPNVLAISLAGVRADMMGAYRAPRPLTPQVDVIAEQGSVFLDALTPSNALAPASASAWTGTYPARHGLRAPGEKIARGVESLPRILASYGYETAAFVSAASLDGRATRLCDHFAEYDDAASLHTWARQLALAHLVRLPAWPRLEGERAPGDVLAAFRSWLGARSGAPWFAWVQLSTAARPRPIEMDVEVRPSSLPPRQRASAPLPLPPSWSVADDRRRPAEEWVAGYAAEIDRIDRGVGSLIAALNARGELRRTIVVVFAEHGLTLGEGGSWFEARSSVSEAVLRVPFIVRGPGVAPGRRVAGPCSIVDLAPTVLGLVGFGLGDSFQGEDLSRYLLADGGPSRSTHSGPVFSENAASETSRRTHVVRLGSWKLVRSPGGDERLFFVDPRGEREMRALASGRMRLKQQLSDILTTQRAREERSRR
jgi:arylsulfatase A-like enzyme